MSVSIEFFLLILEHILVSIVNSAKLACTCYRVPLTPQLSQKLKQQFFRPMFTPETLLIMESLTVSIPSTVFV